MFKPLPDSGTGPGSWLSQWYQPGREGDLEIYAKALQKCREVNQDLGIGQFSPISPRSGRAISAIVIDPLGHVQKQENFSAGWIVKAVEWERQQVEATQASKPEWVDKTREVSYKILDFVNAFKPIADVFVPQSPQYTAPYACLGLIMKGFVARKDKKDSVPQLISSLAEDVHIFEAYKTMFPTDEMKRTLAELYIHTTDLLGRLAQYYSRNFIGQLTDAMLPRAKYNFDTYRGNIIQAAGRLKTLCETGHMAEQKLILDRINAVESGMRSIFSRLEDGRAADVQRQAAELIDIWHDDVGDVENEWRLWEGLLFSTAMKDHWSHNGVLHCIQEWRRLCDSEKNSIFWICSESNGRQGWMTEFSRDLVRVCRSQGQPITFAFCDRPQGLKWKPAQVLKQLIAQILNRNPKLIITDPPLFNHRKFRRATTFEAVFHLLYSIVGALDSLVIVIDRLDLCAPILGDTKLSFVLALSELVKAYPESLRVLVCSAQTVGPPIFPDLPISYLKINTRRPPRKRYEDWDDEVEAEQDIPSYEFEDEWAAPPESKRQRKKKSTIVAHKYRLV